MKIIFQGTCLAGKIKDYEHLAQNRSPSARRHVMPGSLYLFFKWINNVLFVYLKKKKQLMSILSFAWKDGVLSPGLNSDNL
jgi:hypothetical protein